MIRPLSSDANIRVLHVMAPLHSRSKCSVEVIQSEVSLGKECREETVHTRLTSRELTWSQSLLVRQVSNMDDIQVAASATLCTLTYFLERASERLELECWRGIKVFKRMSKFSSEIIEDDYILFVVIVCSGCQSEYLSMCFFLSKWIVFYF